MPTRAPQGKGSRRLGRVHPAQAVPRDLVWGVNPWRDVVAFYLRVELKMDKQGSQAEGIFLVLDETFDLDFWVKILHLHPWATVSGISASATQPQPTRVCRERSPLPATKLLSENYLILSQVVIRFLDFEWWRPVPATSLIS
ncbi:uncharacterized protein [Macaca nemestrina]|uniref:uncharacterized protein isoform X6 n=1 Tax=Macaca nemestrina TaxID=9545 RepID=UPI0039B8D054